MAKAGSHNCLRIAPVVLAVCLIGCGSTSSSTHSSRPKSPLHPQTRAVFSRHDLPPKDVAAVVEYAGEGSPPCSDTGPGEPTISWSMPRMFPTEPHRSPELGDFLLLCAEHLPPTTTVTMTLRRPDGTTLQRSLPASNQALWPVFLGLSWPLGPSAFTVRAGTLTLRRTVTIVKPMMSAVRTSADWGVLHAGQPLMVVLSGQDRNADVPVDVYRSAGTHFRYATTVYIRTNTDGYGGASVPTIGASGNRFYIMRPRAVAPELGQAEYASIAFSPQ